ncbi:MAG: hypothetical protein KAV87_50385 [Desulfobacteraceae bacterium]|nr:hypothetical protein [Desulfobacteraceae bacterium]
MPFGKIETKVWDSLSIRGVDPKHRDSFKLAFIYLLANKHSNPLGYYILPLPYMADDLEWSTQKARKMIRMLERRGLVAYDDTTRIMWVINYLQYHIVKRNQTEISALATLENMPLSKLTKGLYAAVKKEYPTMKFCSYLELLVSDPSLLGNGMDTERTQDSVLSISKSISNSESKSNSFSPDFLKFWTIYTAAGNNKNKLEAYDKWKACLTGRNGSKPHDPIAVAELLTAAEHYVEQCRVKGTEPEHVMLGRTFLGVNQRWKDYVEKREHRSAADKFADTVLEEAGRK